MLTEKNLYCECGRPATWIRYTQFSGNHPFCTEHATEEDNFGKSDPSYFSWEEVPVEKIAPKHKTTVEGYEDLLQLLCERIHRMRYDQVEEFYGHTAVELRQQAMGDRTNGRNQLATLLEAAADVAEQQQQLFARIWALCEPHMRE